MKISNELLPVIYEASKKVYEAKMSLSEGSKYLFESYKLNIGSARIYIIDFKHLLEGTVFKRTLNAYSIDYFMARIKEDYGKSQLKISLPALQKHIHYYEETHNTTLNKLRGVYKKYLGNTTN